VTDAADRRRAPRLAIALPIDFGTGRGLTRDVSGLGIYFTTDIPFEVDSDIDFHLAIPDAVNVRCNGRIVRVDPQRDGFGVAVAIDDYVLDESDATATTRPHIVIEELRKHHGD
jgi:hypothetical protein